MSLRKHLGESVGSWLSAQRVAEAIIDQMSRSLAGNHTLKLNSKGQGSMECASTERRANEGVLGTRQEAKKAGLPTAKTYIEASVQANELLIWAVTLQLL